MRLVLGVLSRIEYDVNELMVNMRISVDHKDDNC